MELYEVGDEIVIIANPELTGIVVKDGEIPDVQFDVDGSVAYVLPHEMMLKSTWDEFHPERTERA